MNSNKYRILLIEDEDNILNFVTALLEANDYQVVTAKTGALGALMYASHVPDLIILDLGLPDMDGMKLLGQIREQTVVPVIVLSARSEEKDKVDALDAGANDYVTKPFGSAELVARVRSALRNHRRGEGYGGVSRRFELDGLEIDYDSRRLFLNQEEIRLTQTEFNIISLLSNHCGKVLTYATIIKAIWGYPDSGSVKKLQVNMANIRKKLGLKPGEDSYIMNELGVGYRMREPENLS